jgi:diguanylate cyclase (GGDEF)-like protein
LQIAKNINAFLKATPIEAEGKRLTVNISAGVSTYPEDALDRESLITTADTALYEAKRNGRDMVLVYTDMLPKTPGG